MYVNAMSLGCRLARSRSTVGMEDAVIVEPLEVAIANNVSEHRPIADPTAHPTGWVKSTATVLKRVPDPRERRPAGVPTASAPQAAEPLGPDPPRVCRREREAGAAAAG